MADWKIILVVLVGLFLITIGLFTEAGMNPGGLGSQISDALKRGFSFDLLPQGEENNITLNGTIWFNELDLKTIGLDKVSVGYDPAFQNSDILLSDTRLTTNSYTTIEISGYKGTVAINGSRLTMEGDAEETNVNGVKFETIKKLIPVNMGSVLFTDIYVGDFYMKTLELEEVTGDLEVQNSVRLELGSEPLKLENFRGTLKASEGKFEINGMAKKVFVSGKDYTATVT